MASGDRSDVGEEGGKEKWSDPNPSLETVSNEHAFVQRFQMLYNSETFSDIVLRVGDSRFYAHKFMLITASEVFEAMLNEKRWKESHLPEVTLTEERECEPVFSDFLKYIYTGSVEVTTGTALPILLLADKYGIKLLRDACVEYMTRHIVESPDTNRTLSWYQYAKMTGNQELADKCSKFILSNFDIILKAADWVELSKQEVVEYMSSSAMVVKSEFQLWTELERWLTHENNRANLQQNLADLLPRLRLTMIPPKHLLQIEKSRLYQDYPAIFADRLSAAYRHHSLMFDQVELNSESEQFRNYSTEEYGICHDLSLLNYTTVSKIDSKISLVVKIPLIFVPQTGQKKQTHLIPFEVNFWPKGYYTTFTLYGNHIGRQTDSVSFRVRRASSLQPLPSMVGVMTLIIYGMKNGVKYVASTFTASHVFRHDCNTFMEDNIINIKNLTSENSPYLINGNLDAKVFIKIHSILEDKTLTSESS